MRGEFVRGYSLLSLVLVLCSASSVVAQADCKTFFESSDKLLTVPVHRYTVNSAAKGASQTSESISVNGISYVEVGGKWTKSRFSVQAMHEQELENRKNNKVSCQHVRDESVNGEAASVFVVHSESEDSKADATAWISKRSGLLLRQDNDLEGRHISTRYEYTNVTAPTVSP
jgi:hypothetical protein